MIASLLIVPMGAAFTMVLLAKARSRIQDSFAFLAASSLFVMSALTLVKAGASPGLVLVHNVARFLPPAGIALAVDGLSALMLVIANLVAFFVALYSAGYMREYTDKWKFYTLFFLMASGINGVLMATDIFNLYVFMEIAAISAYFLVAFGTGAEELEASFKYAVMGSVASAFILLGIAFLYAHTSTLNMAGMAYAISSMPQARVIQFVSVLFIMGFGLKAALVPFHAWLAYAHSSAPAPVSSMLSGVLIKALGIYAIARIFFNVFGLSAEMCQVLITLGVLSMVVGSILAFGQSDIKRLFAYSTVSQIGYVAMALGVATPLALAGALFHLLNHSIVKSLLFMTAGSIERVAGTRDLGRMSGIIGKAPVTGYACLTGALSICGIPPFGGFWAKLIIILACVQAGRPFLALVAVSVSVMTLAYYFRSLTPALFGGKDAALPAIKKIRPEMNVAMAALAILALLAPLVFLPGAKKTLIDGAITVLSGGTAYANMIFGAIR
ncbi:MAG: proton-conducting transporter membrane subunit [Candidatus Omnitrophota bacterium]